MYLDSSINSIDISVFVVVLRCLLVVIFSNSSSAAMSEQTPVNDSEFKLELVQVIFRHGDRTPDEGETYPNDLHKINGYAPFGYGQLTNDGKVRALKVGELLRKQYGEFLDNSEPDDVFAYSTNVDRTKMTLQIALAGLFYAPTKPASTGKPMRVPIHTVPVEQEMFFQTYFSPEYNELFNEAVKSPEVQGQLDKFRDLFDFLSDVAGHKVDLKRAVSMHRAVRCQMELGLRVPDWCRGDVYARLQELEAFYFELHSHTEPMRKIAAGGTINMILVNILKNEVANNKTRLYLYSAHDLNVITFLRAHDVTRKLVDYGCTVMIEKYRRVKDNELYIRFLLWPGSGERVEVLRIKDCPEMCPLSTYVGLMYHLLPNTGEDNRADGDEALPKLVDYVKR